MASLGVILALGSCKQRDDYPDFSNIEPPKVVEDIIPSDNSILPISQKIMSGTTFVSTFLIDSNVVVAPGVEYTHFRFMNNLDQKTSIHIVEIDRSKANIGLTSLSPYDDYLYATQQLPEMMAMNQETLAGDLAVGLVGGAHSSGNPTAAFVVRGRLTKANTSRTLPYIGTKKIGTDIDILNSPNSTTYPAPAIVFTDYYSLIGGASWLTYQGNDILITSTATARSGLGMTADKQKIYLLAVDGVNAFSAGVSTNNFIQLFKALGCTNSFYTNGGTSNALAIRQGKDFVLKNFPATTNGQPAAIANGIGFVIKK